MNIRELLFIQYYNIKDSNNVIYNFDKSKIQECSNFI